MTSQMFIDDIIREIEPYESPDDVIQMIDILAQERAKARNKENTIVDYIFSGGILCIFFKPLKLPAYIDEAKRFRRDYKDIAVNDKLKQKFLRSLTPEVLAVDTLQEVVNLGFNNLFRTIYFE